jgi:hypothetical protein
MYLIVLLLPHPRRGSLHDSVHAYKSLQCTPPWLRALVLQEKGATSERRIGRLDPSSGQQMDRRWAGGRETPPHPHPPRRRRFRGEQAEGQPYPLGEFRPACHPRYIFPPMTVMWHRGPAPHGICSPSPLWETKIWMQRPIEGRGGGGEHRELAHSPMKQNEKNTRSSKDASGPWDLGPLMLKNPLTRREAG